MWDIVYAKNDNPEADYDFGIWSHTDDDGTTLDIPEDNHQCVCLGLNLMFVLLGGWFSLSSGLASLWFHFSRLVSYFYPFIMQLLILTPTKIIFDAVVRSVSLPGSDGSFQVLPGHAPLVSTLSFGKVIAETDTGKQNFTIQRGFVDVHKNKVTVLTS